MHNPETAFWLAVVARAWADALTENPSPERDEARQWLTGFSADFRLVCHLAGIDPEYLQEQARAMERRDWPPQRRAA